MSKQITVSIGYLGQIEIESGRAAKHGARASARAVEPTLVTVAVSDDRIATIDSEWGDRIARGEVPKVYGTLVDATQWGTYEDGSLRLNGYAATDEALLAAIRDTRRQVAEAWLAAIATRTDVATVVEDYRAVLDALDRQYAAHHAQWEIDAAAIARKFRRQRVEIGEQTVPGKHCVRSARGTLLGYANCWDGKWLGTIERI